MRAFRLGAEREAADATAGDLPRRAAVVLRAEADRNDHRCSSRQQPGSGSGMCSPKIVGSSLQPKARRGSRMRKSYCRHGPSRYARAPVTVGSPAMNLPGEYLRQQTARQHRAAIFGGAARAERRR